MEVLMKENEALKKENQMLQDSPIRKSPQKSQLKKRPTPSPKSIEIKRLPSQESPQIPTNPSPDKKEKDKKF